MNETENQFRLRRAKEAYASCREAESEARKALAYAVESTKLARDRYEQLFAIEEQQECARRRESYNHCTK